MMFRGHNGTAPIGHLRVDRRSYAVASFGQNACPNTPSKCLGMHLIGANSKSAERLFSDYRLSVH
jgi:hypothetical protein